MNIYQNCLKYKLYSHPPALFDRYRSPRESQKPQTADVAWEATKCAQNKNPSDKRHFVINGGMNFMAAWHNI